MAGAAGFDDHAHRPLVIGQFYGVRQWARNEDGRLKGVHSMVWEDGENVASCGTAHEVPFSLRESQLTSMKKGRDEARETFQRIAATSKKGRMGLNDLDMLAYDEAHNRFSELDQKLNDPAFRDCGCGFWAYWKFDPHEFHLGEKPVVGIVEGYGKTIVGTRGFRCAKARIVALHCAYEYVREIPGNKKERDESQPGWHQVFSADYEQGTADAIARLAQDEEELQRNYPSATVYSTLDAMMKMHPPGPLPE
jgi:hypothetical protein